MAREVGERMPLARRVARRNKTEFKGGALSTATAFLVASATTSALAAAAPPGPTARMACMRRWREGGTGLVKWLPCGGHGRGALAEGPARGDGGSM
uniref:Uncharacterized protein n=1 Tax=Oryza nivara TaxID=4536 RepID=A0A0E0IQF8_ORYNI